MAFLRDIVEKSLPVMNDEWTDAILYTPYQDEQALMNQYADMLAVRAFLRMAKLPFKMEQRPNAEFMSPTGEIPFLRLQNNLVPGFASIVDFVGKKGIKLSNDLSAAEQADVQAFCALVEETLRIAERYMLWNDESTYNLVTSIRYASVHFWPLNILLPIIKRRQMISHLNETGWTDLSLPKVIELCDKSFHALSVKLGRQKYFVGEQPTELDALAFGHLYTILTTEMPNRGMIDALKKYPNLIAFCKNIDQEYFSIQQA